MKKRKNNYFQRVKNIFSHFKLTSLKAQFFLFWTSFKKHFVHFKKWLRLAFRHPFVFLKKTGWFIFRCWKRFLITLAVLLILFYPLLAFVGEKIDVSSNFSGDEVSLPESQTIETAKDLITREVSDYGWRANLPIVFPSALLDNMPSFQTGIMKGLAVFTSSFSHQNMKKATELLNTPGDIWYVNFSSYLKPSLPSVHYYRRARGLLKRYNRALLTGEIRLDMNQLERTLKTFELDLRQTLFDLQEGVQKGSSKWIDTQADNLLYEVKGKMYTYALLIRDLKKDFDEKTLTPEIEAAYEDVQYTFAKAYQFKPFLVFNTGSEGIWASHLSTMGFYVSDGLLALIDLQTLLTQD